VIGMILMVCLLMIHGRKKSQARYMCQQYLNAENQKITSDGVKWVLPEHFPMWVEIHNEFRKPHNTAPNFAILQANPFVGPPKSPDVQIQVQIPSGMQTPSQQYNFNNHGSNTYSPPQQYSQTITGQY